MAGIYVWFGNLFERVAQGPHPGSRPQHNRISLAVTVFKSGFQFHHPPPYWLGRGKIFSFIDTLEFRHPYFTKSCSSQITLSTFSPQILFRSFLLLSIHKFSYLLQAPISFLIFDSSSCRSPLLVSCHCLLVHHIWTLKDSPSPLLTTPLPPLLSYCGKRVGSCGPFDSF